MYVLLGYALYLYSVLWYLKGAFKLKCIIIINIISVSSQRSALAERGH